MKGPHGDLVRKHDTITRKWTNSTTQQRDPFPRGKMTGDPKETSTMPDEDLAFDLTYGLEGEIPPISPTQCPLPLPLQQQQGNPSKNFLDMRYLQSDE